MSAIKRDLDQLYSTLDRIEFLEHAVKIISYDMETAAPKGGMDGDARDIAILANEIFKLKKDPEFMLLIYRLKRQGKDDLDPWEKRLLILLQRELDRSKGVSAKLDKEAQDLFSQAYITWIKAKEDNNYEEFKETLEKIAEMEMRLVEGRLVGPKDTPYNILLSNYEYGFTTADLDSFFAQLEQGIVPLFKAIRKAKYKPRHDFLTRQVPISKQQAFTNYLLEFNGFDFSRGSVSTTEHPFTEQFGPDDVRVTTKYSENSFISNMYTVIHEGGHALFGQNLPAEVFSYHLGDSSLSMAKHESVSRFYENVIGRSKEYIHAIYPKFHEIFSKELGDVSENDLYEGVNYIDLKNPLRTEADELTYSLHIIIRYRLEKKIMDTDDDIDFDSIRTEWNQMYKDLLDIEVPDDKNGILQDVHWASGFGYFPTYAIGNALNCMYVKKLDKDIGFSKTIKAGKMDKILSWMKENVFATAPLYDTKEWIKNITGEDFSAKDYVEYLTNKYTKLYHLTKNDIKNANKPAKTK